MTAEESDFIDDIVANDKPAHTGPLVSEFHPWHKVRKEFIRQHQWNELTRRLIKRRWKPDLRHNDDDWGVSDGDAESSPDDTPKRPLRCLVIPGDDLLDVRSLWRDTAEENCHIRYLGFNERYGSNQDGTRVHVANNAVTSLPRVERTSQVVADRFESIGNPKSQACRYLREYGPYHVVNLDFCGSIFPNTQKSAQPSYDALRELLRYQFAEQRGHWLLFVTTEVQPSIVDKEKLGAFSKLTRSNIDEHSEFSEAVANFLPVESFLAASEGILLELLDESQTTKLFGVGLGKWLLQLGHSAQPQWTVEMRRSFQYCINEHKGAVMLALAFEFSPNIVPPTDHSGISASNKPTKEFPTECDCAVRIAKEIHAMEDVDARLLREPELRAKLLEDKASLLESAGFDRAAYVQWVRAGEITLNQCK